VSRFLIIFQTAVTTFKLFPCVSAARDKRGSQEGKSDVREAAYTIENRDSKRDGVENNVLQKLKRT